MKERATTFLEVAEKIGKLLAVKRQAYGDSFEKSADFLRLLFPTGIPVERYGDMLALSRIFDKLSRIANGAIDTGQENPYEDLAGYAILGVVRYLPEVEKGI